MSVCNAHGFRIIQSKVNFARACQFCMSAVHARNLRTFNYYCDDVDWFNYGYLETLDKVVDVT